VKCIVGLGNPGNRYRFSRHNIGFRVVEHICEKINAQQFESTEYYECSRGKIGESDILLAMPQTYMNNSGIAVRELLHNYDIAIDDVIIVYDDFQIPFGTLRIRAKGSDGGHNGMASVIYHLQSEFIPRLRVGVAGNSLPEHHTRELMADYVLSRFTTEEETYLPQLLQHSNDALTCWTQEGIARAMNVYNKRFFTLGESRDQLTKQ